MKICFLASANSAHLIKWSKWFSEQGHKIDIITFEKEINRNPYAKIYTIPVEVNPSTACEWEKIRYLTHGDKIRELVEMIQPDVINVHYASSYGVAAALAGIGEYILSVWGSDIFSFPKRSFFHRHLIKFSLQKAKWIFSTSRVMANETQKYTDKDIFITPFGVDMKLFRPLEGKLQNQDNFVVGTVKTLAPKYGIEYLLKAVAIIRKRYPDIPLQLRIAGQGISEDNLKLLAQRLGINEVTTWLGYIPQEQAAEEWANFDVAVVASDFESFGVAAVEAQACGTPIIVSDAPGLLESTLPGVSSIVVPRKNVQELAEAILRLYYDKALRREMGNAGRQYVLEHYEINHCFNDIIIKFNDFQKVVSHKG